jgi:WD40 repeat protein
LVRKIFAGQLQHLLSNLPQTRSHWGVELAILEGHDDSVVTLAFSSCGQLLASASDDNTVKLWDVRAEVVTATLQKTGQPIAFSPDGELLASALRDKTVCVWDVKTGVLCSHLSGHSELVCALAFSLDSSLLASGSKLGTVMLWCAKSG